MHRSILILLGASLGITIGSALALYLPGSFSRGHQIAILLHGPAGIILLIAGGVALVDHIRWRVLRINLRWPPFLLGGLSAVFGLLSVVTAVPLFLYALTAGAPPAFRLHGVVSWIALVLAVIHTLVSLRRFPESARGAAQTGRMALIAALFMLVLGGAGAFRTERQVIVAGGPDGVFGPGEAPSRLQTLDTRTCGSSSCHPAIAEEHRRSAHAVSPAGPFFLKTAALLHEEGSASAGFCTGCHYPATESGRPSPNVEGVSCMTCHAVRHVERRPNFGSTLDLSFPTSHTDLLSKDGLPSETSLRSILLRAAAPSHGRAFAKPVGNDVCLACHGLYIPDPPPSTSVPSTCSECHMFGQADLHYPSADGPPAASDHLSHTFAGGNRGLFVSLGDRETAERVRLWLTGNLLFPSQIHFWSFADQARPSNQAAWLVSRWAPESRPVPGAVFRIKLATTNVGIGHPFPSAPMDLTTILLDATLTDVAGETIWRVEPGAVRLGGTTVVSDTGRPLDRHRVWVPHHNVDHAPIARGQTAEEMLEMNIPTDEATYPLTLTARWMYTDLPDGFRSFVGLPLLQPDDWTPLTETKVRIEYSGKVVGVF